jgi:superfamily II DNA or RNA helicase
MEKEHYFYIKHNKDYDRAKVYKYGMTNNLSRRLYDGHELFLSPSTYICAWKFRNNIPKNWMYDIIFSRIPHDIKRIKSKEIHYGVNLQYIRQFAKYNKYDNGGDEFMSQDGLQCFKNIINNEIKYFKLELIREISREELEHIYRRVAEMKKEKKKDEIDISSGDECDSDDDNIIVQQQLIKQTINNSPIILRDYQLHYIEEMLLCLRRDKRVSCDLATGGGKSMVVFNCVRDIQPTTLVILSPTENIRDQNANINHISVLGTDYSIHTKLTDVTNTPKNVYSVCIQSSNREDNMELIKQLPKPICLWVDEGHWGLTNADNELIFNGPDIEHRIFTSATWDRDNYDDSLNGELVNIISPYELIEQKWLAGLEAYIFVDDGTNADHAQCINSEMKKLKRHRGFISCVDINHATAEFNSMHRLYQGDPNNTVKPFIYVGERVKTHAVIPYRYDIIKAYEQCDGPAVVFAVRKISMGYDFVGIDYIGFTHPKHSQQDIMQIIGRGLRPDGKGDEGRNRDKKLCVMLFTHNDLDTIDAFDDVKDVLSVLVREYELSCGDVKQCCNGGGDKLKHVKANYQNGVDVIESKLMLMNNRRHMLNGFISILKRNDVCDTQTYHELREDKPKLELPLIPYEVQNRNRTENFRFELLFEEGRYYTKSECELVIKKINLTNKDIRKIKSKTKMMKKFNEIDGKIPPISLKYFYK